MVNKARTKMIVGILVMMALFCLSFLANIHYLSEQKLLKNCQYYYLCNSPAFMDGRDPLKCQISENYYIFYSIEGSGSYLSLNLFLKEDLDTVLSLIGSCDEIDGIHVSFLNQSQEFISKGDGLIYIYDYDFDGNKEIVVTNISETDIVEVNNDSNTIEKSLFTRFMFVFYSFINPCISLGLGISVLLNWVRLFILRRNG